MKPWLELIRLPNVFTAPGDSIAGFLLAACLLPDIPRPATPIIIALATASCLFYMAGMALNDLADLAEDGRDRPQRPLPSGAIRVSHAALLTVILFGAGLGLCAWVGRIPLIIGTALAATIILYDTIAKHVWLLGPFSMGLCRGLNFLLGASALGSIALTTRPLIGVFVALTIFIGMVTIVARYETEPRSPGMLRWFPAVSIVGYASLFYEVPAPLWSPFRLGAILAFSIAVYLLVDAAFQIGRQGRVIPPNIGQMIGALLFLQVGLVIFSGYPIVAAVLLLAWPANKWCRKRIYAS